MTMAMKKVDEKHKILTCLIQLKQRKEHNYINFQILLMPLYIQSMFHVLHFI